MLHRVHVADHPREQVALSVSLDVRRDQRFELPEEGSPCARQRAERQIVDRSRSK